MLCLLAGAVSLGCSTTKYRESADKESYAAINEKSPAVPNMSPAFTIDVPKEDTGLVGLGTPPLEPSSPSVRFEVMKFGDAQPKAVSEFSDD